MAKKKKPKKVKYNPMAHELSGRKYRQRRVPDKRKRTLDQWMQDDSFNDAHGPVHVNGSIPGRNSRGK